MLAILLALTPFTTFAGNAVVNMSHYDMMRPDFVAMKNEGVVDLAEATQATARATDDTFAAPGAD
jgi:hypothetical protein